MRKLALFFLITIISVIGTRGFSQTIDTVCIGASGEIYKVLPTPGSVYYWEVEGGSLAFPSNTCQVAVNWGFTPGLFRLKVHEVSSFGCPGDTVVAFVWVRDDIKINITGPKEICEGEGVLLTASGSSNIKWFDGTIGKSFYFKPSADTLIYAAATESGCKPDTSRHFIKVHPSPSADFTFNPDKPITGKNTIFKYTGKGGTFLEWFFNEAYPSEFGQKVEHRFTSGGSQRVQLIATNEAGCKDTAWKNIIVEEEVRIYVPNAFTPNSDGKNEFFNAVCTGVVELNIEIFNRWGEKIHTIYDQTSGWDGTYMGKPVQEDVYMYMLSAKGVNNRLYNLKGTLTLIR